MGETAQVPIKTLKPLGNLASPRTLNSLERPSASNPLKLYATICTAQSQGGGQFDKARTYAHVGFEACWCTVTELMRKRIRLT